MTTKEKKAFNDDFDWDEFLLEWGKQIARQIKELDALLKGQDGAGLEIDFISAVNGDEHAD